MSKLSNALKAHKPKPVVIPEKVRYPDATPARRGKVGFTVFVDPETHKVLKTLALVHDTKIQHLLLEGINLVLQNYGKKPTA